MTITRQPNGLWTITTGYNRATRRIRMGLTPHQVTMAVREYVNDYADSDA